MNRIALAARRAVMLAASAVAACRPAAPPLPAQAPAPAVPATPAPAIIADPALACVVQGGRIFTVEVQYRSATNDSVVNGRPLHEVYPLTAEHAATARWYHAHEPITFAGHRYTRYGLPRVLGSSDVVRVGNVQGVSVFAEPSADARPYVIYLPVEVGCIFQPYQAAKSARPCVASARA